MLILMNKCIVFQSVAKSMYDVCATCQKMMGTCAQRKKQKQTELEDIEDLDDEEFSAYFKTP